MIPRPEARRESPPDAARRLRNLVLACCGAAVALLVVGAIVMRMAMAEVNPPASPDGAMMVFAVGCWILGGFAALAGVVSINAYARMLRDMAARGSRAK